jgi:hypothetical protein
VEITWTSEQRQRLAREIARVGFRPDDLLPTSEDETLGEPEEYLALLGTIPDGAGVEGYIEALRRRVATRASPGSRPDEPGR